MKKIDYQLNFAIASDWVYALSGKKLSEYILSSLPHCPPELPTRRLAEIIVKRNPCDEIGE